MATLEIMKARTALEIRRANITAQIASAISTAITAYQGERWLLNESRTVTFATVANQEAYAAAASASIPLLRKIDYLTLLVGNQPTQLCSMSSIDVETANANGTNTGQPGGCAFYQQQFRLSPIPSDIWTIRLAGVFATAEPATDGETGNAWMTTGERLIRCRAKWELATHVTFDDRMRSAMAEATQEAWNDLKSVTNQLTGTGRIRASTY